MGLVIKPRALPVVYLSSELGQPAVRRALRSGEYVTVRPGAFATPPVGSAPWERDEARALAQIAAVAKKLSNGAVFSHRSAALLHGLWLNAVGDRPEVTQTYRPNSHGATSLKRYRAELAAEEVTSVSGVLATSIERTIVDCARTMHPRDAIVVADSGMRALVKPDKRRREQDTQRIAELRGRLMTMVGVGPGRGRRRARAVIRAADPYAESPKESVLRWIAVAHGLPTPHTQLEVRTRGGVFYVDLAWRWQRRRPDGSIETRTVYVEYDGDLKYLPDRGVVGTLAESSEAIVAEKRREDLLRELPGSVVLRFARRDLRDADAVFARLLAATPVEARKDLHPVGDLLALGARH